MSPWFEWYWEIVMRVLERAEAAKAVEREAA